MPDILNIADFLLPVDPAIISEDELYHEGQFGKLMLDDKDRYGDPADADIIIIGCPEQRGAGPGQSTTSPDEVRKEFYKLYNWHETLRIADAGNIKAGADLSDTYAALKTVLKEIDSVGKTAIVIGGSHDLMLAQYQAFADREELIEVACVDARMDLDLNSPVKKDHFLMEILTTEPNFIRHYNHIGFQSYFVHPQMLETLDKLRFDCFRVGKVRENMEEMEPVIRHAQLFSFDICAIANAYAPSGQISPNGFTGDEACSLMRYAGMSPSVKSVGIFGYDPSKDRDHLTAIQISQMLWYFLEGRSKGKKEARIQDRDAFNEYHMAFAEVDTVFLQSKRTGRWWMQLPDKQYIACSYSDYLTASNNQTPERWLRAQERDA